MVDEISGIKEEAWEYFSGDTQTCRVIKRIQ
jgi:hypothetical protein